MSNTNTRLMLILVFSIILIISNVTQLSEGQTENDNPAAVIKPFPDVKMGESVELNGTQSYDPGYSDNITKGISEWSWFIRPGGQPTYNQTKIGDGKVLEYVFDKPGDYIVNLTVTDMSDIVGWNEKMIFINGPDLQVRSLTFDDPDINYLEEGDHPTITVAVENAGTMEINASWTLKIIDEDEVVTEEVISDIIPTGEIMYYNYSTYKMLSGERQFKVVLDADDDVIETCEDNNEYEVTVNIQKDSSSPVEINDEDSIGILLLIIIIVLIIIFIPIVIIIAVITLIVILKKKKGSG